MSSQAEASPHMEPIRAAFRNATSKLAAAGRIEPIDAALGAVYATHDLAMRAGMDAHAAIEWMRTAADLMERQLLEHQAARRD